MTGPSPFWPAMTVAVGLIAWVVAVRFRRGPILAPFSLSLLMLVSIFGMRPLFMIKYDEFDFYGLDVTSGFNATARTGFVATAVLCVAYWVSRITDKDRTVDAEPPPPSGRRPPGLRTATMVCLGTVAAWFLFMAYIGGGPGYIALLFRGKSPEAISTLGNTPAAVFCIPIAGAVVVACARIHLERERRLTAREKMFYWGAIAATTVPASSLGGRRFLIPCLLVALIAVVYGRWARPVTLPMAGFSAAALFILAAIPFVRSSGARRGSTDLVGALGDYFGATGLMGTLKSFFVSYDTEGFEYVAYVVPRIGSSLSYGYGRGTVGDLLLNPLPVSLADLWTDRMLTDIFGAPCATGVCPIPSVVGVLLFDFGSPAVVAGCFALGFAFGRFERALLAASSYSLPGLLLVAAYAPIFVRGNSANVVWLATCTFVISALLYRVFGSTSTVTPVANSAPAPHSRCATTTTTTCRHPAHPSSGIRRPSSSPLIAATKPSAIASAE